MATQTACLLVATVALVLAAAQASKAQQGGAWEPLLNGHGAHDEEQGGGDEMSKRWQLVNGVLKYVWPDTTSLQLRCAVGRGLGGLGGARGRMLC